jgi:uncharacterized membrane protein
MIGKSAPGSDAALLSAISRRVQERELQRQVRYNAARKYIAGHTPTLLSEFLKLLLGSLIAFWVVARLLGFIPGVRPVYAYAGFGLLYSLQTTYYKYKLSIDAGYKIPRCRCGGQQYDDTEVVLKSKESALFRVPNSVLGGAVYVLLAILIHLNHGTAATALGAVAVLLSAYLGYVMVVRIASLCPNCVNVAALNVLILWQLLR